MYPYTQNTGSLLSVIKAIGSHGVPNKFTAKELPVWGFKSSNDRNISNVLKFIGFLDNSGIPQDGWTRARTDAPSAVAAGVRAGYAELFQTFPDAHRKDTEALTNFFKAKTTVGDAVVKQMVSTFRALAQFGNFDAADAAAEGPDELKSSEALSQSPIKHSTALVSGIPSAKGMTINLNIELSVPTDSTGEVYDKFFSAMKKHLLDAQP
jgi:hypothetical protein